MRITKDGKCSKRRIDLAVSALMAFDLAASEVPEYDVLDGLPRKKRDRLSQWLSRSP